MLGAGVRLALDAVTHAAEVPADACGVVHRGVWWRVSSGHVKEPAHYISWWQQGIGSGHSTWALTVHVRHPMCVRCKE
jgi:hypothetical protein